MAESKRTVLHDHHLALKGKMVEFAGWEMPIYYPSGIVEEHLATRRGAGLFDVSHMGRFVIRGGDTLSFLQSVLTGNAEALDPRTRGAQYTFIPTPEGGAVDDAYLYRFVQDEHLLVVNAANRENDWAHLQRHAGRFADLSLADKTDELVMLALQGPAARDILNAVIQSGSLPEPQRNAVSRARIAGAPVRLARTGYTGEPLCFELFAERDQGVRLWDLLLEHGATAVGLGARDTLRLEAGLPLYGHELGRDIPLMACPLAAFAVSFSERKGDFVGRQALLRQSRALAKFRDGDFRFIGDLPRVIKTLALAGRGVAREGAEVRRGGQLVGHVTSGTAVPFWTVEGEGLLSRDTGERALRSICLALLDSDIREDERVTVHIRDREVDAVVVPYHLRSDAPPYARPILWDHLLPPADTPAEPAPARVRKLLEAAVENTRWRQERCINLIPSEMTASPMTRLLSIMDPAFRYAEHRKTKAFYDTEVFYYQGTRFIAEVERLLEAELRKYLGCPEVETRIISGQMANMAVFSGLVDFANRVDRAREPQRIRLVMNHHIGKGGHLSAQPMGALRDFVARNPKTELPAVVNFPVLADNPYRIDVPAALQLIAEDPPELIIFGKSLILHREPISEIRRFLEEQDLHPLVLYDMAHVLGLVGPHFQQPFEEGADLVTGSTHKTFFGTQRGIIGGRFTRQEERYELWEAIARRTFPGSVSNHHLGTLLGLLMAAYEMNHFKDDYQRRVVANAKAFARALHECGLAVAGDPGCDFTETHQVVLHVGYGRGSEMARRLEANNIICNYQAVPGEEGFTAAGGLRLGVAEMTRFGMDTAAFGALALLIAEVLQRDAPVIEEVQQLRSGFAELRYCFRPEEFSDLFDQLHRLTR